MAMSDSEVVADLDADPDLPARSKLAFPESEGGDRSHTMAQVSRTDYQYRKIYRYEAPWTVYALNWSVRADQPFRLALGSFMEEYGNKVQLVSLASDWVDTHGDFICGHTLSHPYPATKVMWIPDPQGIRPDLLATSGDYLRVWRCPTSTVGAAADLEPRLECLLNHNKNTRFCSPLTSFDWNETDPSLLATSSSDTTCTIWALETRQIVGRVSGHGKSQIVNHDKEVYDVAFGGGRDVFASVGADGALRMFDMRQLDRNTVVYEEPQRLPLLRLAWNKKDLNYVATAAMNSTEVVILDLRMPGSPVVHLNRHGACVNGITWAPHSSGHICTAADDHRALIWDFQQNPPAAEDPILTYTANGEINNVQWASANHPDWIAICYKNFLELLRV
ncbi:DDB1- and CUL4-associated factor 7-like [Gracilinanus agilis]|uniref:DDB1- and CUL4-associated factor 7-like n=1 Tax=Gracilinanus agilis TaxID=191870 RepID=UPI001CFD8893|nr:DDB1- and CUL4-associated factor 7-like [Gracilinanus agilis]